MHSSEAETLKTHIVSFSGGQTSGLMLRKLMDANAKNFDSMFEVCFDNTGKEYDETLDFVHDVETKWSVPITWLEYCRKDGEHSFKVVDYFTATRRNSSRGPFDEMLEWAGTLPNVRGRGCSGQLKVRTTKRYLQAKGLTEWDTYVGIRIDEAHRAIEVKAGCPKYIRPHFPLIESKTTKLDVDNFWDQNDFKLNIPNHKGNCDLCFLKAKWKRLSILRDDPTAANWWINWEKKFQQKGVTGDGARWQAGLSYETLLKESQHPEFDFSEQDVPCSCAVSGFREKDE